MWVAPYLSLLLLTPQATLWVVFADQGVLQVEKVELTSEDRVRLWLPGGGLVEVPLRRVERVVELHPEPSPEPPAQPTCGVEFVAVELPPGTPYAREILQAAARANLHPLLLRAVVEVESRFNPWAVSPVGARGLMQLMPAVWLEAGLLNPHDAAVNLLAGSRHLRKLLDRFGGRLELALAAYNAGSALVERFGGVPPFRETRAYVAAVLGRFCPSWSP